MFTTVEVGFLCLLAADERNAKMSLRFGSSICRGLYLELVLADLLQLEFFLLCLAHDVNRPGSKKSKTKCE
jgi:hypothetical protein